MRLGIFGGSFDPVHYGHIALARACQSQALLDGIWFTPTAIQPLKLHGPHASDSQRVEMIELAIESAAGASEGPHSQQSWRVCTLEIDRGGPSYTVDTLRQLHMELPDAALYFLVGADALRDVARWREPREIFRLATPLVVGRADQSPPDLASLAQLCTPETQPQFIQMPPVAISSSDIRRRVAAGDPIGGLVPAPVAEFIARHCLYTPASALD